MSSSCLRLSFVDVSYMYRVSYGNCNSSSNRLWVHARCVNILLIMSDMDKLAEMVTKLMSTVESQATEMQRVASVLDNLTKIPAVVATPASSSESVGTDVHPSTHTLLPRFGLIIRHRRRFVN